MKLIRIQKGLKDNTKLPLLSEMELDNVLYHMRYRDDLLHLIGINKEYPPDYPELDKAIINYARKHPQYFVLSNTDKSLDDVLDRILKITKNNEWLYR